MTKREVVPCNVCGNSVYCGSDGKPHDFIDDSIHTCSAAAAAAARANHKPEAPDVATCTACGLRSRSALIVKRLGGALDGERGRCVNTAACEKRQQRLAKADA